MFPLFKTKRKILGTESLMGNFFDERFDIVGDMGEVKFIIEGWSHD
jgi:hypothetical protein